MVRMKTIGVLTGGGDCPGLNAVIRAVVRSGIKYNFETLGIRNGWRGLIDGDVEPLTDFSVSGILPRGGTILGTSRTNPLEKTSDFQKIKYNMKKYGIYALVVIGGDGTLSAARDMAKQGIQLVGVPKTIDNDINYINKYWVKQGITLFKHVRQIINTRKWVWMLNLVLYLGFLMRLKNNLIKL